jgi:hypothetical protein
LSASSGDPGQPAPASTASGAERPSAPRPTRVLIVAHRTAATPKLLAAVEARASRSPCVFTLLVPRPYWDPDTEEAANTLALAVPLLERASGRDVQGIIGVTDPLTAVEEALGEAAFDEVIISTLPSHVSRWLRRDLPHRIAQLGPPVTVVTAEASQLAPSALAPQSTRDST